MPDHTAYPLKLMSRTVSVARTNRLRISWFALGVAAGVGSSVGLPALQNTTWLTAAQAPVITEQPSEQAVANLVPPAPTQVDAPPPAPSYPKTVELKVKNGDTLIDLLADAGVSNAEAYSVLEAVRKVYNPRQLNVGQNVSVTVDKRDSAVVISGLEIPISATTLLNLSRKTDDSFAVKKVEVPVEKKLSRAGGKITGSLYETGVDAGIPPALLSEIINAYSYDVDFQRDIQRGDGMDVLFEKLHTPSGEVAGYGNVIYAELDLGGNRPMRVYRFVDKDGRADYYNEKGESVRKALLRTPVNGAKITSRFGMRTHPILGYSKMHRGVDFGAPQGTPIYAAGDGVVEFSNRKGGYGNYLKIKHNGNYASAYGHISRFASGIRPGAKVRQGQVVAYVGSTGASTGPHLHYEILVNNQQVNPANVKFKTGNVLAGKQLAAFKKTMESIQAQLDATPKTGELAMADTAKASVN